MRIARRVLPLFAGLFLAVTATVVVRTAPTGHRSTGRESKGRKPGASPHNELSACRPVDLANPITPCQRACKKHKIAKARPLTRCDST